MDEFPTHLSGKDLYNRLKEDLCGGCSNSMYGCKICMEGAGGNELARFLENYKI